jgi:hypothetical protein
MSSLKYYMINQKLKIKGYKLKVVRQKILHLFTFHFSLFTFLLLSYSLSIGAEISGHEVRFHENDIFVTASLSLDNKYLQELNNGITKEFRFYVDIFRVWKIWPDEFILSRSFIRRLMCDPVKKEYIATSNDGTTLVEKRFKSFESMTKWALTINDLKLANLRELEPGVYFVRVTAESKIRKLPPVIGYFMIFSPETEFKLVKDSFTFSAGSPK